MTPDFTRREAAILAAALGGSLLAGQAAAQAEHQPAGAGHQGGSEEIAMVLYPGMTHLDLVGPLFAFSLMRGAKIHLVASKIAPVPGDGQLAVMPTHTYGQVPADLDLLFVPGAGPGTIDAMRDQELLSFLADRGKRARYVTSVCTGSLVLGAAGLLKGYRATSHWVVRDSVLPLVGATPVNARYVKDRNRITGGGVTSGIDFGLRLVAEFRGEAEARHIQLMGEYDPDPPFNSGSPNTALPETVAAVRQMASGLVEGTTKAARESKFSV